MKMLFRIDRDSAAVTHTFQRGFDAEWITYGEDALWLSNTVGGNCGSSIRKPSS